MMSIFLLIYLLSFVANLHGEDLPTRGQWCDGMEARFGCSEGMVISNITGIYGRYSLKVCNDERANILNNNCENTRSMDILRERCVGHRKCVVQVSEGTFGHPVCQGLASNQLYLDISIFCHNASTVSPLQPQASMEVEVNDDETVRVSPGELCPPQEMMDIHWPATVGGDTALRKCPPSSRGTATFRCEPSGNWVLSGPNMTDCVSDWVEVNVAELARAVASRDAGSLLEVKRSVEMHTMKSEMFGGDVPRIMALVHNMTLDMDTSWMPSTADRDEAFREITLSVTNNLIGRGGFDGLTASTRREVAADILDTLEKVYVNTAPIRVDKHLETTGEIMMKTPIAVQMINVKPNGMYDEVFPSVRYGDEHDYAILSHRALLPFQHVKQPLWVFYANIADLEEHLQPKDRYIDGKKVERHLISRIVGLSIVFNYTIMPADMPNVVTLQFYHDVRSPQSHVSCGYWSASDSDWSTDGCSLLSHNQSMTVCKCSHLTYFAVLADVHGHEIRWADEMALTFLTYAGCTASIVCLLATFICLLLFDRGGGDRVFVHLHLTLTLAAAEVVFLVGIWRVNDMLTCRVVAGVLFFLLLSAFTWMFLEGLQLYYMLVEVFTMRSRKVQFVLAGYGLPALITAVAHVVDPRGFGTKHHCWLGIDSWAMRLFVAPVLLVLFMNMLFLALTMRTICRHSAVGYMPCRHQADGRKARTWVKGALALLSLLGLTWIFGFFWLDNESSIIFAYAFTISNSFQGCFIFLFHVIFCDKMRKDIGHWLSRRGCCVDASRRDDSPRKPPSDPSTQYVDSSLLSSHDRVRPSYHDNMDGGQYEYATIAYGDMAPPSYSPRYPSFTPQPLLASYHVMTYAPPPYLKKSVIGRHPPELTPPLPPTRYATRPPSSDDSAYSDGSSSLVPSELNAGSTVLRIDLKRTHPIYCQDV